MQQKLKNTPSNIFKLHTVGTNDCLQPKNIHTFNTVALKVLSWSSGGLASNTGKGATVKGPPN